MKKSLMIVMAMLLGITSVWSRPATRGVAQITQPDGTTLSLCLIGDEWRHYNTTADGYAIVRNDQGYYVYAQLTDDGQLAPTSRVAHDEAARTADEQVFLQQTGRIAPKISNEMALLRQQAAKSRQRSLASNRAQYYDYDNFKGLVLLVEYNDCPFRYEDYHDIMEDMINQENYTGNDKTNFLDPSSHKMVTCVGSMHDYFRDNSNGIFAPTFDVVGPIQINRSMYYSDVATQTDPGAKSKRSMQLMIDACTAADSQVDFSQYDRDGDGRVDMIYFIFSGLPSYISGNDPRLLWPHQGDVTWMRNVRKDGVLLGRYACSTELFGYEPSGWSVLEGIGTMCHEFSHVLGLPDFYDTDNLYEDQLCVSPGEWSLMDHGYDQTGRCPVGYSLFERYALGFTTPQIISTTGTLQMESIDQSNTGYRLNTPQKNEYFMLENRQSNKWDAQLPSHGMLVWRVDSTNVNMWRGNSVNDNPEHPYYELVRAGGAHSNSYGYYETISDPFPGANKVTQLDNLTSPASLRSWAGKNNPFGLTNIQEQQGVITFDVFDANVLTSITLQDEAMLGVGTSLQLVPERRPDYAPYTLAWNSSDESVVTVSDDGLITGISEGNAVVTVIANDSLTASCQVSVRQLPIVPDIASFLALDDDSESLIMLNDAQVLYTYSNNIYLRDASGTIVLSSTGLKVAKDDILNGAVYGQRATSNRMPALKAVNELTTKASFIISKGNEAQPVSLHISQLDSTCYSNLVTVTKVQLVSDGGMFAVLGDKRYRLYNTFKINGIKVPTDLNKRYDVTAVFGTNTLKGAIIDELYLLKSPAAVSYNALTAISLPSELQLPVDRIYQLEPQFTPSKPDVFLKWTSSNEQVATVNQDGLVTTLSNGITTITVVNLDNGLSAQCQLTVGERVVKNDIADFKTLETGKEAQLTLTDALVTFVYKNDAYLRDATGAIRLASTGLDLKVGDVLNGYIYGRYGINDEVPELQPISGSTNADGYTITAQQSVEPREVKVAELSSADYADLVILREVQITTVDNLPGAYVVDGDHQLRVYNTFGLKNPIPTPYFEKTFNLTGILTTAKVSNVLVNNLALTDKAEEIQIPDAISDLTSLPSTYSIYTLDGRLVYRSLSSETTVPHHLHGFYILQKSGQTIKVYLE